MNNLPIPELWEHQKVALNRAISGKNLGIFFDLGTGKTRTTLEIMKWHISHGRTRFLIFAPPVVLENWKREILKFTDIPEYWIYILYGEGVKRDKILLSLQDKIIQDKELPYIVVTNYESVNMAKVLAKLLMIHFDALVCDEIHRCKDIKAKRTKSIIKISKNIKYRYGLTGTPVLNNPMDLFSQYMILFGEFPCDPPTDNFYSFRNRYFYDKNAGMPSFKHFPNWQTKKNSMEELNKIVQETAITAKKSECLSLPPFIQVNREIELGKDQKKAYDEMFHDFMTYIGDEECVAQLALTKGIKLMQIVSGFIQVNEEKAHRFKDNPRIKVLEELLLELTPNHKVIVWASWKDNYSAIKEVCMKNEIKFAMLHGEINTRQKFEMVDKFNKEDTCRVMIGNQMAGGVGVNLTASDYSIYYSRDFKLEGDLQSEARNYRGGSEIHEKITRIDLIARNTIDEIVLESLSRKETTCESLLKRIRTAYGNAA